MLDVMYDVPMKQDMKSCRITKTEIAKQRDALGIPQPSRRIA
jgi:ATP-dependent protease Clp ATPase subunit